MEGRRDEVVSVVDSHEIGHDEDEDEDEDGEDKEEKRAEGELKYRSLTATSRASRYGQNEAGKVPWSSRDAHLESHAPPPMAADAKNAIAYAARRPRR